MVRATRGLDDWMARRALIVLCNRIVAYLNQ